MGINSLLSSPHHYYAWKRPFANALLRHSVVTTVRTQEKADKIASAYKDLGKDKLSFAIVPDIAQEGAFEEAVVSDPPFDYVVCVFNSSPSSEGKGIDSF